MEQRPLRLGDILDDYCPRERRVTNHAIVAMVGEDVKQTRCTTCDAEHAFKGGRQPRRKKKDAPSALYHEVLAGMSEGELAVAGAGADVAIPAALAPPVGAPAVAVPSIAAPALRDADSLIHPESPEELSADAEAGEPDADDDAAPTVEEGPVHRRLIRATLPRPEGVEREARPVPEFTMRQNGGRPGGFRGAQPHRGNGSGSGNGNGHRSHGRRFAGGGGAGSGGGFSRGPGQGGRGGFRGGPNAQRPAAGKKRSR